MFYLILYQLASLSHWKYCFLLDIWQNKTEQTNQSINKIKAENQQQQKRKAQKKKKREGAVCFSHYLSKYCSHIKVSYTVFSCEYRTVMFIFIRLLGSEATLKERSYLCERMYNKGIDGIRNKKRNTRELNLGIFTGALLLYFSNTDISVCRFQQLLQYNLSPQIKTVSTFGPKRWGKVEFQTVVFFPPTFSVSQVHSSSSWKRISSPS